MVVRRFCACMGGGRGDHMGYSEAVKVADECQPKGKYRAA